jgi:hypothetical protein
VCKETTSLTIHTKLNRNQNSLCSNRSGSVLGAIKRKFAYLFKPISVYYKIEKHKSQPHTSAFVSLHESNLSPNQTRYRSGVSHTLGSNQPQAPGKTPLPRHPTFPFTFSLTQHHFTFRLPLLPFRPVTHICNTEAIDHLISERKKKHELPVPQPNLLPTPPPRCTTPSQVTGYQASTRRQ